jgi:hypothetical protein
MSIQPFFTATAAAQALPNFFPMTAAGTYTVATVPVGVYKIETSTNQSFTIQFRNSSGYRFSSYIQGGQGFISIPMECTQIIIPGGLTYGPILTYTKTSYTQGAAPTSISWTYNANGSFTVAQGTIAHTSPAGTTSTVVYWTDGTSTALGSGTPTATTTMYPTVGIAGQSRSFALVSKDANGVEGLATVVNAPTSPVINYAQLFTSNGTFTTPVGVTALKVVAQGGGGGGGSGSVYDTQYNNYGASGGGGAGGYVYNGLIPVFASTAYAVVVGGGGGGSTAGNPSSFNATTVVGNGGGRGGDAYTSNAGAGGCGGGGGFYVNTFRPAGSGNQLFNGAPGAGPNNTSGRGGGGGGTGGNASGASGGSSATITQITPAGTLTLGGGGNGGYANGSNGGSVGGYGAGGGGQNAAGASGMVCVGYTV